MTCAVAADGSVIVGWIGPCGSDELPAAHLRVIEPDGSFRTGEVVVDDAPGARAQILTVAASDGGFVAAWSSIHDGGRPAGVQLVEFSSRLEPLGDPRVVSGVDGIEPRLAAADDGRLALTWLELRADHYDVWVRRLTAGAEPELLRSADGQWLSGASVALGSRGDVLVAWNASWIDRDESRVEARRFDAARGTWGEVFSPTASTDARLAVGDGRHCVALHDDGRMAFAWSGDSGDDPHAAILTLAIPVDLPAPSQSSAIASVWPTSLPEQTVALPPSRTPRHLSEAAPHDPPTWAPPYLPPLVEGAMAGPDTGFNAVRNTGWTPPDPHIAAGPGHVMMVTNGAIAAYRKDGSLVFQDDISGGAGFWGSLGATGFVFDPEVIFDPHSNRFIAMACERTISSGSGLSMFLIGISDDADPAGVWHKYRVDVTGIGGGGSIDSPNMMVDQNVVYLSADFFGSGRPHLIVMFDKTPLLSGAPVGTMTSLSVPNSPQSFGLPVMYGGSPVAYMIDHLEATTNTAVKIYAILNPLTTPSLQSINVTVPAYRRPVSVPQLGTSGRITTFDARFWSCTWRNGSLWATQHEGSTGRTLQRWYEISTNGWPASGTAPTLVQSGTVDNGPGVNTFFGSIHADDVGNAVMCYAQSSTSEFISIGRSYRLASDPIGTMRPRALIKTNAQSYGSSRWGDYSEVAADPADPSAFWYGHEWASSQTSWETWIGRTELRDWLSSSPATLSAASGGAVDFVFENSSQAGDGYLLLITVSGRGNSILNPGGVSVPIVLDALTNASLGLLNTPLFSGFLGTLDANGVATPQLNLPGGLTPLAGLTFDFACATFGATQWQFGSNAVSVLITP